jgi:hypothetical protein
MKWARALLRRVCDAVVRRNSSSLLRQFIESLEPRRLLTQVTAASFDYDFAPNKVNYTFDTDVSASLSTADQSLINLTTGEQMTPAQTALNYDSSTNTASFTFPDATPTYPSG